MERETVGGRDVGQDLERDLGGEPPPVYRDSAPELLAPFDPHAPVSGHVRAQGVGQSLAHAPEHDWGTASSLIFPALRPAGTVGIHMSEIDRAALVAKAGMSHTQPLLGDGPCGLALVYAIPASGFDVIVNADHVLSWGIGPQAVHDAAMANLAAWSASAAWTDEASGERRLVSSDTGEGWDAARILLPEVRRQLTDELAPTGRVLIGLPERHLLLAGSLTPGDDEFVDLFRTFIVDQSSAADEPIDQRAFELVGAELVEFVA